MVTFGTGQFAACMRAGMKDVVDIYAIENKAKNPITFDKLMGIFENNSANEGGVRFSDCEPDFKTMSFVIPKGFDEVTIKPSYYCQYNYAKLRNGTSGTYFYAFITGIEPVNSEATRFTFTIDWWHTHFKNTYKPLPKLKKAYVTRRNTHKVTTDNSITTITVPEVNEQPVLFDELELEYKGVFKSTTDITIDGDAYIKYLRIGFSESAMPDGLKDYFNDLYPHANNVTNNLYYVFVPVIPKTRYQGVRIRQGAYSKTLTYETYIKALCAGVHALTLSPTCVSFDLLPNIPFVSRVDTYTIVDTGTNEVKGTGIELLFGDNCVINTSKHDSLKDTFWIIQTEIYTTSGEKTLGVYNEYHNEAYNFPAWSCVFDETDIENYSHQKKRVDVPIEPKIAQPQYSKSIITDNAGASFEIKPYQANSNLTKLRVISVPSATTYKRKFYLCTGDGNDIKAYNNDIDGRRYCATTDRICALPIKNNALIDYMNGNRNQMINGLAVGKIQAIQQRVQGVGDIISSVATMGAGSNIGKGSMMASGARGMAQGAQQFAQGYMSELTQEWAHEAQIADLNEKADTVSNTQVNNAEYEVMSDSGVLEKQVWIPSLRDRTRLVEYFHKNGYAVGEYQDNISLDTMYYFDYIEATNINFATSGNYNNETDVINLETMGVACEEYIRGMFAKGIRIWHGRAPQEDTGDKSFQFFETPYLNTAKEY